MLREKLLTVLQAEVRRNLGTRGCGGLSLLFILAAATAAPSPRTPPPPRFIITELPTLGGHTSDACAVNDKGQAVGEAETPQGTIHACLWADGAVTDLGVLPHFPNSHATAINDSGQVAGDATPGTFDENGVPFLWQRGRMALLPTPDAPYAQVFGINAQGEVAGVYSNAKTEQGAYITGVMVNVGGPGVGRQADPLFTRACTWQGGKKHDIGKGAFSIATSVDRSGCVVGETTDLGGVSQAVIWRHDVQTVLGPGHGLAVNSAGQVAGWRGVVDQRHQYLLTRACLWSGHARTDLGLLPGFESSMALGLNDAGQAVGDLDQSVSGGATVFHAVLWQRRQAYDLNALLPVGSGWFLQTARAINGRGQIVGVGLYHGQQRGFLLTPR